MKDNTITTADGIEVYTSQITEIGVDQLEDQDADESSFDF